MNAIGTIRRPIIAVSLKMYMGPARALEWARDAVTVLPEAWRQQVEITFLPNFLSIIPMATLLDGTGIGLGAQNLFWEDNGAYTGEVSGPFLREAGCSHVEIGHAERRRLFGETDRDVKNKFAAATRAGLVPILCVGETVCGAPSDTIAICLDQIRAARGDSAPEMPVIVAWEPIWAIGASEPAEPAYICEVAAGIRAGTKKWPGTRLIYGGSAGPGLLDVIGNHVDGLFLGRFSHDVSNLKRIVAEALFQGEMGMRTQAPNNVSECSYPERGASQQQGQPGKHAWR